MSPVIQLWNADFVVVGEETIADIGATEYSGLVPESDGHSWSGLRQDNVRRRVMCLKSPARSARGNGGGNDLKHIIL